MKTRFYLMEEGVSFGPKIPNYGPSQYPLINPHGLTRTFLKSQKGMPINIGVWRKPRMVECPRCGSYAVEAYLYTPKPLPPMQQGEERVYYGNHCLACGLKSSDVKENAD